MKSWIFERVSDGWKVQMQMNQSRSIFDLVTTLFLLWSQFIRWHETPEQKRVQTNPTESGSALTPHRGRWRVVTDSDPALRSRTERPVYRAQSWSPSFINVPIMATCHIVNSTLLGAAPPVAQYVQQLVLFSHDGGAGTDKCAISLSERQKLCHGNYYSINIWLKRKRAEL